MDNECKTANLIKYNSLRKFRHTSANMDLQRYKAAKVRFKTTCRLKRLNFEKEKRVELMHVSRNPCEYWKVIK